MIRLMHLSLDLVDVVSQVEVARVEIMRREMNIELMVSAYTYLSCITNQM